eukprot:TRINITY_DN51838_c0_g1_i1.p1 TRINITY_DN51838_c0_g1~~TRINITY_DN51838_c0_g1_i1.p1  ORF type:complete len:297 (-),score=70.38 TRINITY_DN51838_c0_g1_i1:145-951(-)
MAHAQESGKVEVNDLLDFVFTGVRKPNWAESVESWTTDDQLKGFAAVVPAGVKEIQILFESPDKFTDAGMASMSQGFPKELEKLALAFPFSWTECSLSAAGIKSLMSGMPEGLASLELVFGFDEFDDEALKAIAAGLPKNLKSLGLSFKDNADFTDAGVTALIAGLPSSLTNVRLSLTQNTNLTDASLIKISEWFAASGKTLEEFAIVADGSDRFTEVGLKSICSSLPSSLQKVSMSFASIHTSEALQQMSEKTAREIRLQSKDGVRK